MLDFIRRHETLAVLLMASAIAAAVLWFRPREADGYSLEAHQRAAVARDLTAAAGDPALNQARGNQGLVGSLYLAPMPTALVALLALLPGLEVSPFLCSLVAAVSSVFLGVYVYRLWRHHGVSVALRIPAVFALLLFPPVVRSIWLGQTTMLFVALVVCGCAGVVEWLRGAALRDLALAGLFLGLSVVTRYQGIFFAAAALAFIAAAALMPWRGWGFFEGTVITYCVPVVYAILLWLGGNWLVLGNPLFFLRAASGPLSLGLTSYRYVLAWGCPWLLLAAVSAFVFAVPLAASLAIGKKGGLLRHLTAGGAVLAACVGALAVAIPTGAIRERPDIARMVRTLERRYRNTTFIVSGYSGYSFVQAAGDDASDQWVHTMHLMPEVIEKVIADYQGRNIMLLVNAAELTDRWQDVDLTWLSPQSRIPERFIYRDQIGPWTLFHVLSAQ